MNIDAVEELRSRIRRIALTAHKLAAPGHEQTHTLDDGTTHHYKISGIKSPEQLHDELLTLFIWVWSLKDHLKELCKVRNLDPQTVEEVVNRSPSLQYVADIANRAKHGILRNSRSGQYAELSDLGFTVPQTAVARITVGAFNVGIDVARPDEVELRASIKLRSGDILDAFATLNDANNQWEKHIVKRIVA